MNFGQKKRNIYIDIRVCVCEVFEVFDVYIRQKEI